MFKIGKSKKTDFQSGKAYEKFCGVCITDQM